MKKVLLVDDSSTQRSLLTIFLRGVGCDFVEAGDGQAALERAAADRVDLVIADINMPTMDGVALVQALRGHSMEHVRRVPVILITAARSQDRASEGIRAGANECLTKPVSAAKLVEVVKKYIDGSSV